MNQTELQDEVKILRGQVHCYNANLRRIQRLTNLLIELETVQQSTGSGLIVISKDSPSGNGEQTRLQLIEDLEFCRREIESTQQSVKRVEKFLRMISVDDQKLMRAFMKGRIYRELADDFGYTTDGVYRRITRLMASHIIKNEKRSRIG